MAKKRNSKTVSAKKASRKKRTSPPKQKTLSLPTGEPISLPPWEKIVLICLSFLVAAYLINNRITAYSDYIHVSDEVDNMRAIECLALEGKITAGVPGSYAYVPDFELGGGRFEYWVETLLRAPGYVIWKDSAVDWGAYSGFLYFFFIGLVLLGLLVFHKKEQLPILIISFLVLLIANSNWSSASFYFVRYYVFLMYGFLLCQFIAARLLLSKASIRYASYLGILLVSILPAIFHKVGYLAVPVWITIIGVDILSRQKLKEIFVQKNLKWFLLVTALFTFGGIYFINKLSWIFTSSMIDISWKIGPGIEKFIQLSIDPGWPSYLLIGATVAGGMLFFNYLSRYERMLLLTNTAFFVLSFFVLMFFMAGKNYVAYSGYNRYAFIVHISFLLELAILAVAILKFVYTKIPDFPAKGIAMMAGIMGIFLLGVIPTSKLDITEMDFSMRPRLTYEAIQKVKNQLDQASPEKAIIVTNQGFVETAFQEYPVFFLVPPPEDALTFSGKAGGIYSPSRRGAVGTEAAFCQMLEQYPNRGVFYFYIEEGKADATLIQKLKQNDLIQELVIRPGNNIRGILCR